MYRRKKPREGGEEGKFWSVDQRTTSRRRDEGRTKLGSSSTHTDAFAKHDRQTKPRETGIPSRYFFLLFFSFLSEKKPGDIFLLRMHTSRTQQKKLGEEISKISVRFFSFSFLFFSPFFSPLSKQTDRHTHANTI